MIFISPPEDGLYSDSIVRIELVPHSSNRRYKFIANIPSKLDDVLCSIYVRKKSPWCRDDIIIISFKHHRCYFQISTFSGYEPTKVFTKPKVQTLITKQGCKSEETYRDMGRMFRCGGISI